MTLRSLAGALATGLVLALASPALGASGITPLSPKSGSTVPAGTSPTFKMRVKGAGQVWVHVCKSKKKGGVFQYKPKFFDYDTFWLNTPGTYYWQAHRISCEGDINDCRQEGPTVKFKVG